MLASLISHYRWYEVVFDAAVLITGLALGIMLGLFLLLHHIAAGYTYLRRVSISRTITDSDLWVAFAWGARRHRREAMREYERTIRPPRGRRGGPRLLRFPGDRASDDRKTGRAG